MLIVLFHAKCDADAAGLVAVLNRPRRAGVFPSMWKSVTLRDGPAPQKAAHVVQPRLGKSPACGWPHDATTADPDRSGHTTEQAAHLFHANATVIARVIEKVCRQARLHAADADDFASDVNVALIENSYAILRAWRRGSSLVTYLTVIVRRLLADQRARLRGRFEASAAARRAGPAGILLETIVCRDGRPLEQALPLVQRIDPSLRRSDVEAILRRLPVRVSLPRTVALDEAALRAVRAVDTADVALLIAEADRLSAKVSGIIRRALAVLPAEDVTIVRWHFASAMSIAEISRFLGLPQRPLYRRLEATLACLRAALVAAGIDRWSVQSLIGSSLQSLDFGLTAFGRPEE
jgi:RNA polymerase sigma factor (sigma-70 family)